MTQITLDTLDFANQLEVAGVDPKIAKAHAMLQAKIQNNIAEKLDKQQITLAKLTKHDWATKEDINRLETKINIVENKLENKIGLVENKINMVENRLLVKLGGIMVGCSASLGALATFFHIAR
jgi:hypothetical protein